jgi:hypothetical protein
MTLTQITLFFLGIMAVIVIAMLVHSYLDKRGITKRLRQLTAQYKGVVLQESIFQYPRFHSESGGRRFDLFFDIVKVGRHHILYSIYSITASLPHSLLLVKKDDYKAIADEARFTEENGGVLMDMGLPFEGRSHKPQWAEQVCQQKGINELIHTLDSFSSLQLGPDALVAGKPYEAISDTDPEWVFRSVKGLEKLAYGLESCTH